MWSIMPGWILVVLLRVPFLSVRLGVAEEILKRMEVLLRTDIVAQVRSSDPTLRRAAQEALAKLNGD